MDDLMPDIAADKVAIRELVENWAVWRDARLWDRFRTGWHPEGRMMATWFQGTFEEFIKGNDEGWKRGVRILHFLGGSAIDVAGNRAIAQTKMTISQRAPVDGVVCDVVCTGRFYDFFEKRDGPARPGRSRGRARARSGSAATVSRGLPAPRLSAEQDRLQGENGHAWA